MNVFSRTFLFAWLFSLSSLAIADGEGFHVHVGGNYEVTAKTGSLTAVALGKNASADLNIGGIQAQNASVSRGHDYRVNLQTGPVTAVSLGFIGTGPVNLGGVQTLR